MPINILDLDFAYGDRPIFKGFRFESHAPTVVGRGPSGCGKTTLLKILAGLLQPTKIEHIPRWPSAMMIVQEDALMPWLTGMQNITCFMDISSDEITNHAFFQRLEPLLSQLAGEMSFGQRRIIELFRAVLGAPALLCLDEPYNFLDPNSREEIATILNDAEIGRKTQLVVSSHYEEDFFGAVKEEFIFDGLLPVRALEQRGATV